MAKQSKVYAVRNGLNKGLFFSWDDCKKQVAGVSGAEYKSFLTIEAAKQYLLGDSVSETINEVNNKKEDTTGVFIAYTDGSFTSFDDGYQSGFGVCLVYENEEIGCAYGKCLLHPSLRNIGGEIAGASFAINWALSSDVKEIYIYHDLINIKMWGNGEWKRNKPETIDFYELVKKAREQGLTIVFKHVKGHADDMFNNRADELASLGAMRTEDEVFSDMFF